MEEIVRLEDVVLMRRPNRRVINGVNLCLHQGEFAVIVCHSGEAREALMKLIAGREKPSDGNVLLLGQPVHTMNEEKVAAFRTRHIGIVPGEPSMMKNLTVWENVALPLMIRKIKRGERDKKAREWLQTMGLKDALHRKPASLSIFDAARAAVARAMAAQPEILLCDDPAENLNAKETGQFMEILHSIVRNGQVTLLYLTSDPEMAGHGDRRIILREGRMTEEER